MNAINELNDRQKAAALEADGHILVLAGAGSGKTRVLTHRIVHLVNELGVRPHEILAITFTNKASGQMRERLSNLTDCAHLMWISTIHAMCTKILRFESHHLGFDSNFSIYSEQDSERAAKRIINSLGWGDNEYLSKNVLWHISTAKTLMLSPEEYGSQFSYIRDIDKIVKVFSEYQKSLKACNSMDFDDLLLNTLILLRDNADVKEKYSSRFRYISVDEFQDTSSIQYEILKMLQSKHNNLFVVGDDDQSIYGWRGAEIKNILNFDKDFPDAKIFRLEQNYRSTKKILTVANEVISKNAHRMGKQLWTQNADGVKVETYSGYNEGEEAFYAMQQVENLMAHSGLYSGLKYSDFAVLIRVNALTRSFEQECARRGIPFKVFGGFKFFERKEIKDLTAYLKITANPSDDEAFLRMLNTPKRGIGDKTAEKLVEIGLENGVPLLKVLFNDDYLSVFNAGTAAKLRLLRQLLTDLFTYSCNHPLLDFVKYIIEKIGYRQSLESEDDGDRLLNIDEFLASVHEFCQQNPGAGAAEYISGITLSAERELSNADDSNFVSIATIHAAKGLEFKVVFVAGLDDGLFPLSRAAHDKEEMEEERRLMYVAVTRARERLYLTRAKNRFLYGETRPMAPSVFFRDAESIVNPKPQYDTKSSGIAIESAEVFFKNAGGVFKPENYKTGAKVRHKVFGEGVIVAVSGQNADISFKDAGVKTLALRFAPLEVINE